MTLLGCTELWGTATVLHSDPVIENRRDAVFLPMSPGGWFDTDPAWGIYDANGALIEAAAYRRDYELAGQSSKAQIDVSTVDAFAPEDEYIYAGPLIVHYGHFLVGSLSRLWILAETGRLQGRKVLVHAGPTAEAMTFPFIADIFGALGLNEDNVVSFDTPLRIRSLIVPGHSFAEQMYAHKAYFRLCQAIGRTLLGDAWTPPTDDTPVYLSRSALSNASGRFCQELEIEDELASNGVRIVHPELLSLREQIALFTDHRYVLGPAGSAFHTCVFAPPENCLIPVFPTSIAISNFALIDGLRGRRSLCVHPSGEVFNDVDRDGFLSNWIFEDPRGIAHDLLMLVERERCALQ